MAKIIGKTPKKMTELCRKVVQVNIRWSTLERISVIKRFFKFIWNRIVFCSLGNPKRYRRLTRLASSLLPETSDLEEPTTNCSVYDADSDLVSLKICLLGDTQIGKTNFVVSTFFPFILSQNICACIKSDFKRSKSSSVRA